MAVTVQQIYNTATYDLGEDGGLVLGLVTVQQFYDLLKLVILDFCKNSGLLQRIYTQMVSSGTGTYTIPDDIIDIDSVWLAGRWLPSSTQRDLNDQIRSWRNITDIPQYYYTDGLGLKSIGLAPDPNYTGAHIIGPSEPNPPHAAYDAFSALCQVGVTQVTLNPVQHRGLSIVGTRKAITQVSALADPIPLIPDDLALLALPFGVLERIFSADGELLDNQRAAFCHANYTEVLNVCQAITGIPAAPEK
jgi:hypothetical protein